MITNFLIVPTHWTELFYWGGAGFFVAASFWRFVEIRHLTRTKIILQLKTKELERGLEIVERDAKTLNREIENLREERKLFFTD